jgi:hypothetical protein
MADIASGDALCQCGADAVALDDGRRLLCGEGAREPIVGANDCCG